VKLLAAVVAAASLLLARPSVVRSESVSPERTLELVSQAQPPHRDLADLRRRIRTPLGQATAVVQPTDGAIWVNDLVGHNYRTVPVTLVLRTAHADWLVERGRQAIDLARAAEDFESRIFPRVTELTGVHWTPGEGSEPRLAIFHGVTPGVVGYMSNVDQVPRDVFPYSNERLIVYLSLDSLRPGTTQYSATLAHELEHLAHSLVNPAQEGWIDEGLADLVSSLVMGSTPGFGRFRAQSDIQLNAWSERPWEAQAHYEASALWARYLMQRGGGEAALAGLLGSGGQGFETVDRYSTLHGLGGADVVFRDWLVANVLDDESRADNRYGYLDLDQRSSSGGTLRVGDTLDQTVHQFATQYIELEQSGPAELKVQTAPTVQLLGEIGTAGSFFWGLRGDNLDTRLTRSFDLGQVNRASLRFRIWYDLEPDYDACYVLGSSDGTVWTPLPGSLTTSRDTVGMGFGPGYSGHAEDSGWRDELVDLTPFAGGQALVRFECVTDQSYSSDGLALDDIQVPEIGFVDGAESDEGWVGEGFLRVASEMRQPARAMLVQTGGDGPIVADIPLDASGAGVVRVVPPPPGGRSIVIVCGLAPRTLSEMPYRLTLSPTSP
jgi:immune inhibitor A